MLRSLPRVVLLWAILVIIAPPQPARADYYKYTDGNGTVCITNNRDEVPAKYRASMQVIRDSDLARRSATVQKQPENLTPVNVNVPVSGTAPAPAPAPGAGLPATDGVARLTADYPWLYPLAVIAGLFVAFLVVVRLARLLPSPQLARLVYIGFFVGVMVFAYKSYVDYMNASYHRIKDQVLTMYQKANDREGLKLESKPAGE